MKPFSTRPLPLFWVASLALGAACGGKIGERLRPDEHTANEALGVAPVTCGGAPAYARPLVVDLDPDTRVDLEAAMHKPEVVVVAYDCASLRVLTNCKARLGGYSYAGVSRKEQVVRIESADDLRANLPLGQVQLGGEIKSGRSIDLGLVLVGRNTTVVGELARTQLEGSCDGATHFVQNATLGAFSMATGTVGKAAVVAQVFAYGGSASTESERGAVNRDGSLEACRASHPAATEPPEECASPLRVELVPIVAERTAKPRTADASDAAAPPKPQQNPCPSGFHDVDGMCTKAPTRAHLCDPSNERDCKQQCDAGNPESCYNYAILLHEARRGDAATPYYEKACDGGMAVACGPYGRLAVSIDEGAAGLAINRKVLAKVEHGCEAGGATACAVAGDLHGDKEYAMIDQVASAKAYDRGCTLGDNESCYLFAWKAFHGIGMKVDLTRGLEVLTHACDGGDPDICHELGLTLGKGKYGVAKDPVGAYRANVAACLGNAIYCIDASRSAQGQGSPNDAFDYAKYGCDRDDDDSCVRLGDLYTKGIGTAADAGAAKTAWAHVCKNGSSDGDEAACKRLGIKMKDD